MPITHDVNDRSVAFTVGAHRLFWEYEHKLDNPIEGDYDTEWGVGLFWYDPASKGYVMICAINDYPVGKIPVNSVAPFAPYPQTLAGKRDRLVDQMVLRFNEALDQRSITADVPAPPPAGQAYADVERQATFEYLKGHLSLVNGRFVKA